jgi:hypothetical protein
MAPRRILVFILQKLVTISNNELVLEPTLPIQREATYIGYRLLCNFKIKVSYYNNCAIKILSK